MVHSQTLYYLPALIYEQDFRNNLYPEFYQNESSFVNHFSKAIKLQTTQSFLQYDSDWLRISPIQMKTYDPQ